MSLKPTFLFAFTLLALALAATVHSQEKTYQGIEVDHYGKYAIHGEQFAIWNGRETIPVYIKGINMGISVPGTQPGQLAATREDYRRWFSLIKEAGYNTIRLYTLHYPRFYEELHTFNQDHPGNPLLVIQGIWLEEQEIAMDLFGLSEDFDQGIREVVAAVHGDIQIDARFGKAFGTFGTNVSEWVIGYLIGREIFPDEVSLTNLSHAGENEFNGTYFKLDGGGDPAEVWIAGMLENLVAFEKEMYGTVRPVGITSWPTLDPLTHPTEQLLTDSQEDDQKIDLANMVASDSSGGFFIGYHAYPYYPDFIVQDPDYGVEADLYGPNGYLGYLKDLKNHYDGIPLLIAEFGVPSSWGSGHLSPTGMHHGGITEEAQGRFNIRMLDNIFQAGCAGGIQFSLIDEWFKQTWITNPYSDKETRHFWHNITAPEQNFGILSYAPPPEEYVETGSFPGEAVSLIKTSSDYSFFRVRLYMDTELFQGDTLWVAFDTYSGELGESILPNGSSLGTAGDTLRAEFALSIPIGGERADLYVIPSYDIYGVKDQVRIDTVVSTLSDEGNWNRVRWKTNYFYNITQYIGKLNLSGSEDPFQFLNAVTVFNDSIEIRIPWTLLNFTAPTVRRAMHFISYHDGSEIVVQQKDTLSEGIAVTITGAGGPFQSSRYSWNFWDYEKIQNDPPIERKKQSFYYLQQELPRFNSPPIGLADSFDLFPGSSLEVDSQEGLLTNDFDIDGNELRVALSFGNSPGHGTLHLHPDGSFYYFPDHGFQGTDFFSYYLDDGTTNSTLVPVSLHVAFPLDIERSRMAGEGNRFSIYPNPSEDFIFIGTSEIFPEARLVVADMTGREVYGQSLENRLTRIEIGDLNPGVYIFSIIFDHEIELHSVVIQ